MLFRKHQTGIESDSAFLDRVEDLVREIIAQNDCSYYRMESVMEQYTNTGGENAVVPVIRIVSYFENGVAAISGIMGKEFDLTPIDRNAANIGWVDNFSSKDEYFVATFKANRLQLPEYKKWEGKKFEIQVSSILQDAWNGMEKELNLHSSNVSDEVKRDFYRIGAFLEMADLEFSKIRRVMGKTDYVPAPPVPRPQYVAPPVPQPAAVTPPPPAPPVIAPVVVAPVAEVVPEPEVAPPAPALAEQPTLSMSPATESNIESMDMNVDSLSGLALNVNNIENKNGMADEHLSEIMNLGGDAHTHDEPIEAVKSETNHTNGAPDGGVALNIDNVQNFNMNVNGMIERTTEIIREVGPGHAMGVGAFSDDKKNELPAEMDENAQMTDMSLKEFVMKNALLKEVDQQIATRAGAKLNEDIDIEGDVERLRFLKVFTLKQLSERIGDNKNDIVAFAEKWIGKDNGGTFDSGICLFYLEYLLVGKKNDPAFAVEYVLKFISDNDYSARYIIPTYNSIRSTGEPSNFAHLTLK